MSYDDLGGALTGVTEQDVSSALSSMSDRNESDDGPPMGQTFKDGVISRQQVPQFDRSSATYQNFLSQTGRSNTNPYGNRGIFSQLFGMKNVDYTSQLGSAQIQRLNDMAYQRFLSPNKPVSGKFGSLFGGAEGEETIDGPRRSVEQDVGFIGDIFQSVPGIGRSATTDYVAGPLPEGYREVEDRPGLFDSLSGALQSIRGSAPVQNAAELVDEARSGIAQFLKREEEDIIQSSMNIPRTSMERIDALSQPMQQPTYSGITPAEEADLFYPEYSTDLRDRTDIVSDLSQLNLPFSATTVTDLIQNKPKMETQIGSGTLRFSPEGSLQKGLTGGRVDFNMPLKDFGIGSLIG